MYDSLCQQQGANIPLFQQSWWLEEVCRTAGRACSKDWDVVFAEKDGEILGALPFCVSRKFGIRYSLMPQLTQFLGPWYNYAASPYAADGQLDYNHRIQFENEVGGVLAKKLHHERLLFFEQCFSPSVANWLPFRWNKFRQTTAYTYRINDISDPSAVFDSFEKKERQRKIRYLLPRYRFDPYVSPEQVANIHEAYWKSRGEKDLSPRWMMVGLMTAAISRGQGLAGGLRDEAGNVVAVVFAPFDANTAYYLLCAINPDYKVNGLMELLIWHCISHLSKFTRAFDFEGGGYNPSLEHFYRSFGSVQVPCSRVWKLFC